MKNRIKQGIFILLATVLLFACGKKTSITHDFLAKYRYLSENMALTIEKDGKYVLNDKSEGMTAGDEGKVEFDGEVILLTPVKNIQDIPGSDTSFAYGKLKCVIKDSLNSKYLQIKDNNNKPFITFHMVDKSIDPCQAAKDESQNESDGPTELTGSWVNKTNDTIITFDNLSFNYYKNDENHDAILPANLNYKISNVKLEADCISDDKIKSLKKGKFISYSGYPDISHSCTYKIEGNTLVMEGKKYQKMEGK